MKNIFRKDIVQSMLWLIAILLVWELAPRAGLINNWILPPFSIVLSTTVRELIHGDLAIQALNTLSIIVQGFGLAFILAFFVTMLCTWIKPIKVLVTLLCTIFNPLPAIAIMPLFILWFGIGTGVMRIIIVHGVIWALMTHILDGFRTIPHVYRDWGKNIELNFWQMFSKILFLAVMPEVIAGIRVGWGRAWRALLAAEMIFGMIGTLGGVGYYIYNARAFANMTRVMAGVLVIIIIGILVESLFFKQLEKHTIQKWGMSSE